MAPPQGWKLPKPCELCGSSFTPAMPWQKFCSAACKKRYGRQHGPSRGEQASHCVECGAAFSRSNPRQILCSKACRRVRLSRTKAAWQASLPAGYRSADMRQALKRQYDRSIDGARNHGKEWTGPELELVARGDMTREELMIALGRTSYAINSARHLLRVDPRKQRLAGVAQTGAGETS